MLLNRVCYWSWELTFFFLKSAHSWSEYYSHYCFSFFLFFFYYLYLLFLFTCFYFFIFIYLFFISWRLITHYCFSKKYATLATEFQNLLLGKHCEILESTGAGAPSRIDFEAQVSYFSWVWMDSYSLLSLSFHICKMSLHHQPQAQWCWVHVRCLDVLLDAWKHVACPVTSLPIHCQHRPGYHYLLQLHASRCSSCFIAHAHICVCVCGFYSNIILFLSNFIFLIILSLNLLITLIILSHRYLQFFQHTKLFLPSGSLHRLILLARRLLFSLLVWLPSLIFFFSVST